MQDGTDLKKDSLHDYVDGDLQKLHAATLKIGSL
jgi:hypothetical protein